jgi:DNA invertase Pin-like site-specific DNA recombinase
LHVTKEVIEELYEELGEYKKVAEKLNTSRATVSRIINNKLKGE